MTLMSICREDKFQIVSHPDFIHLKVHLKKRKVRFQYQMGLSLIFPPPGSKTRHGEIENQRSVKRSGEPQRIGNSNFYLLNSNFFKCSSQRKVDRMLKNLPI